MAIFLILRWKQQSFFAEFSLILIKFWVINLYATHVVRINNSLCSHKFLEGKSLNSKCYQLWKNYSWVRENFLPIVWKFIESRVLGIQKVKKTRSFFLLVFSVSFFSITEVKLRRFPLDFGITEKFSLTFTKAVLE